MLFSLVVATSGRQKEVERFLQSMADQTYRDFEVILIDQNLDDRLVALVNRFGQQFSIVHLRQKQAALSRARNYGLPHAQGDIVSFPDDDCVYCADTLAFAAELFTDNPTWDGLIARVYNIDKDENAFMWCGDDNSGAVDHLERAVTLGIGHALFFRGAVAQAYRFDETLGPGAGTPWACGEDADYLFRCINDGHLIHYHAKLIVRHPNPYENYNLYQLVRRTYGYGRGNGYLQSNYLSPAFVQQHIRSNLPWAPKLLLRGRPDYSLLILAEALGNWLGYRDSLRTPLVRK